MNSIWHDDAASTVASRRTCTVLPPTALPAMALISPPKGSSPRMQSTNAEPPAAELGQSTNLAKL